MMDQGTFSCLEQGHDGFLSDAPWNLCGAITIKRPSVSPLTTFS